MLAIALENEEGFVIETIWWCCWTASSFWGISREHFRCSVFDLPGDLSGFAIEDSVRSSAPNDLVGSVVSDPHIEDSDGDGVKGRSGHLASHSPAVAPTCNAYDVELTRLIQCSVVSDEDVGLLGIGDLAVALEGELLINAAADALICELILDWSAFGPGIGVVVGEAGSVFVVGGDLLGGYGELREAVPEEGLWGVEDAFSLRLSFQRWVAASLSFREDSRDRT